MSSLPSFQVHRTDGGSTRLVDLDLGGNDIVEMRSLETLVALKCFDLSKFCTDLSLKWQLTTSGNNQLENFDLILPHSSLEDLNLSNNPLSSLDISLMPSLRRLNIDHTTITSLRGASSLDDLTHLSFRSQRTPKTLSTKIFSELQHLHLSSNAIPIFKTPLPFLNLQTLEVASCGLQALSSDFGSKCPNLRSLNLNFNALRDLQPLSSIVRLERLYLAGNRVSKLRQTTKVLESVGASLRYLDLRDNPLTLGFYVPTTTINDDEQGLIPHPASSGVTETGTQDARWQMQLLLPAQQRRGDIAATDRLDEGTRVRRRVYEMLITGTCRKLKSLDGFEVDRGRIGERDAVWRRLRELGVMKEV